MTAPTACPTCGSVYADAGRDVCLDCEDYKAPTLNDSIDSLGKVALEVKRQRDELRRLLAEFVGVAESEHVGSDCDFCGGQGDWTNGDATTRPRMIPVKHRDTCEIVKAHALLAEIEAFEEAAP